MFDIATDLHDVAGRVAAELERQGPRRPAWKRIWRQLAGTIA
jgi:hypothetical protein